MTPDIGRDEIVYRDRLGSGLGGPGKAAWLRAIIGNDDLIPVS